MTRVDWLRQFCQVGNHRLVVLKTTVLLRANGSKFTDRWTYEVCWNSETARTTVGKGSESYADVYEARHAAVLHLASILPKTKAKRLLEQASDLVWEPWLESRKRSERSGPRIRFRE
jgi:hypothetical protein